MRLDLWKPRRFYDRNYVTSASLVCSDLESPRNMPSPTCQTARTHISIFLQEKRYNECSKKTKKEFPPCRTCVLVRKDAIGQLAKILKSIQFRKLSGASIASKAPKSTMLSIDIVGGQFYSTSRKGFHISENQAAQSLCEVNRIKISIYWIACYQFSIYTSHSDLSREFRSTQCAKRFRRMLLHAVVRIKPIIRSPRHG